MTRPLSTATAEEAARLYKALSDPVRLRLVSLVRFAPSGEASFEELSQQFAMPPSSLSHHIKILVAAGILLRERRGTWSFYRVQHLPLHVAGELLRVGGPLRDA